MKLLTMKNIRHQEYFLPGSWELIKRWQDTITLIDQSKFAFSWHTEYQLNTIQFYKNIF